MATYKQLKVSIDPDLAESFKNACINTGISIAAELSAFMAAKAVFTDRAKAKEVKSDGYDTRAKRRRHVSQIVRQLLDIRDFEDAYMDNNLRISNQARLTRTLNRLLTP
jgi:hypothetical protein